MHTSAIFSTSGLQTDITKMFSGLDF